MELLGSGIVTGSFELESTAVEITCVKNCVYTVSFSVAMFRFWLWYVEFCRRRGNKNILPIALGVSILML